MAGAGRAVPFGCPRALMARAAPAALGVDPPINKQLGPILVFVAAVRVLTNNARWLMRSHFVLDGLNLGLGR